MENVVFWLGVVARIVLLLFLVRIAAWGLVWLVEKLWGVTISLSGWRFGGVESVALKTANYDIELEAVYITLRWVDSSCRHFVKVNVRKVKAEYILFPPGDAAKKKAKRQRLPGEGPTRLQRLKHWSLRRLLKLIELRVDEAEVWLHDVVDSDVTLVTGVQVLGRLTVLAQPLENRDLAVSIEADKIAGQFLLQRDQPCSATEDGLYPLAEWKLSSKLLLFLSPLRSSGPLLTSVQVNVLPLSLSIMQEAAFEYAVQHVKSFLPKPATLRERQESASQPLYQRLAKLPKCVEVVLEDVSVLFHASKAGRAVSSKLSRVTLVAKVTPKPSGLPDFTVTAGLLDVKVIDSLSRELLKLHQLRAASELCSETFSNSVHFASLQACLWENEALFWSRYLQECFRTRRPRQPRQSSSLDDQISTLLGHMTKLSVPVVTTVEASDWSVLLRADTPSLQSKQPLCRGVLASCVANLQWSPLKRRATTLRASVRIEDLYLQVPGVPPTEDSRAVFEPRPDDPAILPSLRRHLWGRPFALGHLTVSAEKDVAAVFIPQNEGERVQKVVLAESPLRVDGEGSGVMWEWSEPCMAAVTQSLVHLRVQHGLWSVGGASGAGKRGLTNDVRNRRSGTGTGAGKQQGSKTAATTEEGGGGGGEVLRNFSVEAKFHLSDVNGFVYGTTPAPPAVMLRLDAASLSASGSLSSVTLQADLHGLLLDNLTLLYPGPTFLCSSVANLPIGVGVATVSSLGVKYDSQIENITVNVAKVTVNWSPAVHLTLRHALTTVFTEITEIRDFLVEPRPPATPPEPRAELVVLGEVWQSALDRLPLTVAVNVETGEFNAQVYRDSRLSLSLLTAHCAVHRGDIAADVYDVGVSADGHRLFSLVGLVGVFPYTPGEGEEEEGEGEGGRRTLPHLEKKQNKAVSLKATKAEFVLPYQYNFGRTLDKALSVNKFLRALHLSSNQTSSDRSFLLPDILTECEDIAFQLCDDPFEVKLRANHELMCDEHEQRSHRMHALERKLEEAKQRKGAIQISAEKVQSLKDSLEAKDSEIYCKRAKEMYSSTEALRTALFVYSMQKTRLWVMFDPSMLGEEKLVRQLKDIDSVSPLTDGRCKFSTLRGVYVSGHTQQFQLQLRDYPLPLILGAEVTAVGRMMFAEQEAEEREKRSVVMEIGHPWGNTVIVRKLPPLKYFYDLEMTSSSVQYTYGPCFESSLAQTGLAFEMLTPPTVDPSCPIPFWDKLRLLFHGRIHLVTTESTVILPGTLDPYNNVEFLSLRLGGLDSRLLTNNMLDLEGSLQLYIHTASKYDECEMLNFPHVRSSAVVTYKTGARDPNDHFNVIRCTPDKLPIRPDNQVHDSYNLFRSQGMDINFSLDVQPTTPEHSNMPSLLLYASTLRWLQKYQVLMVRNVSRPIRKGPYFKNLKPKKPTLVRSCRDVSISLSLPKSILNLWSSVTGRQGIECNIDKALFSIDYKLKLIPWKELIRRPRANWTIVNCRGDVYSLAVHVYKKKDAMTAMDDLGSDFVCFENKFTGEDEEDGAEGEEKEEEEEEEEEEDEEEEEKEHTRSILLSMSRLNYSRQDSEGSCTSLKEEIFTHKLQTHNTCVFLKAATKEVVLAMWSAFHQTQRLKKDLSTEALKSMFDKFDAQTTAEDPGSRLADKEDERGANTDEVNEEMTDDLTATSISGSHHQKLRRHSSSGIKMLDQLLLDMRNRVVAHEEERAPSDPLLKGISAGSWKDVKQRNWFIELLNTQITLQGLEQRGFVVASSCVTQVFGCEHEPRLREGDLVSKKSWMAKMQDLQYFCTVAPTVELNRIPWLPLSVISSPDITGPLPQSPDHDMESSLNALLSQLGPEGGVNEQETRGGTPPGEAVGGLVSCQVMAVDADVGKEEESGVGDEQINLQRIASRCHCQVFYVTYGGEVELDSDASESGSGLLTPGQGSSGLHDSSSEAVDTFTFRYPTVEVCTTSSQYALIMDIINNLLLHKAPKKKEALDRHARMQFTLQLSDIKDPRRPVLVQQNRVRKSIENIRRLETQLYLQLQGRKAAAVDSGDESLEEDLEDQLTSAKDELSTASMRLRAMIRAFKESQLYINPPRGSEADIPEPVRRIEIWLDDAHWWLTQNDGQLQVADICFTNFSYNRVLFNDDSGEHRLELGTFKVRNLTPNTPAIYQAVLSPYDPKLRKLRVDKNICLRVFCRDKAPVAGIPVTEHLEVNVVPLSVSLTARFYHTMQDFFFPKAELDVIESTEPDHSHLFGVQPTPSLGDVPDGNSPLMSRTSSVRRSTMSSTTITPSLTSSHSPPGSPGPKEGRRRRHRQSLPRVDDVERMKERASHIKTFIYVKIPQVTLCISYKSENVSFKDLQNVLVTIPTLEYHNHNWTWSDMLMEVKKDYKSVIIQKTLKSSIGMKESDEAAGLASPKFTRHASDLLMGKIKHSPKSSKGRKLLGMESASVEAAVASPVAKDKSSYQPPLLDPDLHLKRTFKELSKMSQDAQK